MPLKNIADLVGIPHTEYLSVFFRREVGMTPGAYRRLHQTHKVTNGMLSGIDAELEGASRYAASANRYVANRWSPAAYPAEASGVGRAPTALLASGVIEKKNAVRPTYLTRSRRPAGSRSCARARRPGSLISRLNALPSTSR